MFEMKMVKMKNEMCHLDLATLTLDISRVVVTLFAYLIYRCPYPNPADFERQVGAEPRRPGMVVSCCKLNHYRRDTKEQASVNASQVHQTLM